MTPPTPRNRREWVRLVDLLDAHQAAELLGLSSDRALRAFASRYDDFPPPVLPAPDAEGRRPEPRTGRTAYWHRDDLIGWRDQHPSPESRAPDSDPS